MNQLLKTKKKNKQKKQKKETKKKEVGLLGRPNNPPGGVRRLVRTKQVGVQHPLFVLQLLWHDRVPVSRGLSFPCELCWAFRFGSAVWFLVDWAQ
jgi:hypothetical protein